jgi:hypothetical protein
MRTGFVVPKFFRDEALNAQKVDEHAKIFIEQVNGGLTAENLAQNPVYQIPNSGFYENNSIFTVSVSSPGPSFIASSGVYQFGFYTGKIQTSLISVSTAFRVVVGYNSNARITLGTNAGANAITYYLPSPVQAQKISLPDQNLDGVTAGYVPTTGTYVLNGNSWLITNIILDQSGIVLPAETWVYLTMGFTTTPWLATGSATFTLKAPFQ